MYLPCLYLKKLKTNEGKKRIGRPIVVTIEL